MTKPVFELCEQHRRGPACESALSVICFVESVICKFATGEISIFLTVPVAAETVLKLDLSETPKTGFVATRPNFYHRR